ncbi:hypothetical protein [Pseudomonas sp. CGJS7]|uniref:hypothetical protein n=1 Tax=Pseudomonas sp. CGJS7 TaxID=3109348 RepID=UPI00300AE17A
MFRASLSRLGLLTLPLLLAVAPAAAIEPFVLVDNNGQVVGPILDMPNGDNGTARVPFRVGNQRITLVASTTNFSKRGLVYFESNNCVGQPYMDGTAGILTVAVSAEYVYVPDGPSRLMTMRSFYSSGDTCLRTLNHDPFRIARLVVDLKERFTPPFRVEASDEVIDLDAPVN